MKRKILPAIIASGLLLVGCSSAENSTTDSPSLVVSQEKTTLTASQILQELQATGLPVQNIKAYNAQTDPNELLGRPGQYVGKATANDSRVNDDEVLNVETFASTRDRDKRSAYLGNFADSGGLLGGWYQYVAGNAILRVDYALTPQQAMKYQEAFIELMGGGHNG